MLDELMPQSLADVAKQLGTEPFEVVRLLVAANAVPTGTLQVDHETVDRLRATGRIEASWWDGVTLPQDANVRRARVRAAVQLLVERKRIGEQTTRLDNVWRGLGADDQRLLHGALLALAEEGVLRLGATPIGLVVSIEAQAADTADRLVAGKHDSPGLQALLEG
jgi:hypothetical protein